VRSGALLTKRSVTQQLLCMRAPGACRRAQRHDAWRVRLGASVARQVIPVPTYLDQVNEYVHRLGGPLDKGIPHHDIMLVEIGSNDVRARERR